MPEYTSQVDMFTSLQLLSFAFYWLFQHWVFLCVTDSLSVVYLSESKKQSVMSFPSHVQRFCINFYINLM